MYKRRARTHTYTFLDTVAVTLGTTTDADGTRPKRNDVRHNDARHPHPSEHCGKQTEPPMLRKPRVVVNTRGDTRRCPRAGENANPSHRRRRPITIPPLPPTVAITSPSSATRPASSRHRRRYRSRYATSGTLFEWKHFPIEDATATTTTIRVSTLSPLPLRRRFALLS